jgi:hypothetical protein
MEDLFTRHLPDGERPDRLVAEMTAIFQKLHRTRLTEALRGDAPDYFSPWEHRN